MKISALDFQEAVIAAFEKGHMQGIKNSQSYREENERLKRQLIEQQTLIAQMTVKSKAQSN